MSVWKIVATCAVLSACAASGPQPASEHTDRPTDEAVAPILSEKCFRCHANGGAAADDHDFSKLATLHAQRRRIGIQVKALTMPPRGADPLTDAQRDVLTRWANDP